MNRFLLANEPVDAQLTVHFHNYESIYGVGSFIARLNYMAKYIESDFVQKEQATMYNFIQTYSEEKIRSFLNEFGLITEVAV